jgi:XTP/dITP diphosphohydrolase
MEVTEVLFATSNQNKVAEANKVAQDFGVSFRQINVLYPEIRADAVATVAEEGARYVHAQIQRPIIVEDSGLYVEALNGFPGAYCGHVFKRLGSEGILKLLEGIPNRKAQFVSAIGYCNNDDLKVFEGYIDGVISEEKQGAHGFGYDPIFIPVGKAKTFAQDLKMKNEVSHRRKATEAFCRFLKGL